MSPTLEDQYLASLSNLQEMIYGLSVQARTKKYRASSISTAEAEDEARIIVDWIQKAIDYKAAALLEDILKTIHRIAEA